jgi:hypothetical protein
VKLAESAHRLDVARVVCLDPLERDALLLLFASIRAGGRGGNDAERGDEDQQQRE